MAINRIQFQKGFSMAEFMQRYDTQEKGAVEIAESDPKELRRQPRDLEARL